MRLFTHSWEWCWSLLFIGWVPDVLGFLFHLEFQSSQCVFGKLKPRPSHLMMCLCPYFYSLQSEQERERVRVCVRAYELDRQRVCVLERVREREKNSSGAKEICHFTKWVLRPTNPPQIYQSSGSGRILQTLVSASQSKKERWLRFHSVKEKFCLPTTTFRCKSHEMQGCRGKLAFFDTNPTTLGCGVVLDHWAIGLRQSLVVELILVIT